MNHTSWGAVNRFSICGKGWLAIILFLFALSACQRIPFKKIPAATKTPEPQTTATLPVVYFEETEEAAQEQNSSNGEKPLRFTLPTPGPAPISLWRPPLYDTPWALSPYDHFYFNRPIAADEVNWPLADYRYGGIFFGSEIIHTGIDIPAPRNTPVLAAAGGRVVSAGYGLFSNNDMPEDPYGLAVAIRHNFGHQGQRLYTVYAHMDAITVTVGQEVQTGDTLGFVGTTGFTTGPHLHFEVRMEQNSYFATFNPELWLAPPQGWGVLAGLMLHTNGSLLSEHEVTVRNLATRQRWVVRSYGTQTVNSDPFYKENLVLSDLPAGKYEISIDYQDTQYQREIEIYPGAVSYFKFRGKLVFDTALPPTPSVDELVGEIKP
jgi:murein DD-endopeptidase MepM/ murein hydrolase activator NlpD